MGKLILNFNVLAESQRRRWNDLGPTPSDFVLYILGMKCATIYQRNEVKDYYDIHALLTQGKLDLAEGIAAASAIYGRQYNPVLTLQARAYFEDLPQPLPESIKADLVAAVKTVSLADLPKIAATQKIAEHTAQVST